jgi:cell filamentation protein
VFDPFGDFDTEGYLRNFDKEKDLEIVKIAEHELFRAQLPVALNFLAKKKRIEYSDFLNVHQILFEGLYPWAGKDRAEILPYTPASASLQSPKGCLSLMTKSK